MLFIYPSSFRISFINVCVLLTTLQVARHRRYHHRLLDSPFNRGMRRQLSMLRLSMLYWMLSMLLNVLSRWVEKEK